MVNFDELNEGDILKLNDRDTNYYIGKINRENRTIEDLYFFSSFNNGVKIGVADLPYSERMILDTFKVHIPQTITNWERATQ